MGICDRICWNWRGSSILGSGCEGTNRGIHNEECLIAGKKLHDTNLRFIHYFQTKGIGAKRSETGR
jgi:hypothetical protein